MNINQDILKKLNFFHHIKKVKQNSSLDITKVSEIELQIRIVQLTSFILIMDTKNTELESRLKNELKNGFFAFRNSFKRNQKNKSCI